jgi:hypothetical protein
MYPVNAGIVVQPFSTESRILNKFFLYYLKETFLSKGVYHVIALDFWQSLKGVCMNRYIRIPIVCLVLSYWYPVNGISLGGTDVAKEDFIVFNFIGHSNMAGRSYPEVNLEVESDRIWMYKGGEEWEKAAEPTCIKAANGGGGPCMHFLEKMLEYYPEKDFPDVHFGVINTGASSMKCVDYQKRDGGGWQFRSTMAWVKRWLDDMTLAGVCVMLGYMEKSNSNFSRDAQKVINDFRSELGIDTLPFIWGELEESGGTGTVYKAILDLPNHIDNVYINHTRGPSGGGGELKNRTQWGNHHFNWYGYQAWGYECADIIYENKLIHPQGETVAVVGGERRYLSVLEHTQQNHSEIPYTFFSIHGRCLGSTPVNVNSWNGACGIVLIRNADGSVAGTRLLSPASFFTDKQMP